LLGCCWPASDKSASRHDSKIELKLQLQITAASLHEWQHSTCGKVAAESSRYTKQQLKVQQRPVELHTAVTAATLLPS
jgi:hypothetical protein